jgi:ankyrin repeat protein
VNARNKNGETVLMYASAKFSAEKVQALLDHGADVRAKNKKGKTALSIAEWYAGYVSNDAIVQLLKNAEAKRQ